MQMTLCNGRAHKYFASRVGEKGPKQIETQQRKERPCAANAAAWAAAAAKTTSTTTSAMANTMLWFLVHVLSTRRKCGKSFA